MHLMGVSFLLSGGRLFLTASIASCAADNQQSPQAALTLAQVRSLFWGHIETYYHITLLTMLLYVLPLRQKSKQPPNNSKTPKQNQTPTTTLTFMH